jgi:hypothetical protein
MGKNKVPSVMDLVKNFTPDPNVSPATRLCRFLKLVADKLPETYVDRRIAARIAFLQARTPGEDSDWVKKKLSNVVGRAKKLLKRDHQMGFDYDFVEGIRATVDSDDTTRTERRRAKNRVVSAINTLEEVDSIIDVRSMKDKDLRNEVTQERRAQKMLEEYKKNVILLPPGKEK